MDDLLNTDAERAHNVLDGLQLLMQEEDQPECPLIHCFTNGLYTRQINMPRDIYIISEVHLTQHQFIVSRGIVDVYNVVDGSCERIIAPYSGITEPGTRRLLYVIEDTIWTTVHPTDKTTVEDVTADIIEKRDLQSKLSINSKNELLCLMSQQELPQEQVSSEKVLQAYSNEEKQSR